RHEADPTGQAPARSTYPQKCPHPPQRRYGRPTCGPCPAPPSRASARPCPYGQASRERSSPSPLRPVKVHDDAALRGAGEVRVVVPAGNITDHGPHQPRMLHPVISDRRRAVRRREHLQPLHDGVAVRLKRLRQPRLPPRRNRIHRPRRPLRHKNRIAVPVRLSLDAAKNRQRLSDTPHQNHTPTRGTIDGPGDPSIMSTSNAPASPDEPDSKSRSSSSSSSAPGLFPPNVIVFDPENWPVVSWPLIERCPDGLR